MQSEAAVLGPWVIEMWLGPRTIRSKVWQIGTKCTEWRRSSFPWTLATRESASSSQSNPVSWKSKPCPADPGILRQASIGIESGHLVDPAIVHTEPYPTVLRNFLTLLEYDYAVTWNKLAHSEIGIGQYLKRVLNIRACILKQEILTGFYENHKTACKWNFCHIY